MAKRNKTGETIVVRIEGKFIAWTDGYISGDKELVKQARLLSRLKVEMFFPLALIKCNLDDPNDPAGAIAAMWGISPGRALIMEGYRTVVLDLFGLPEEDPGIGMEHKT